MIKKTQKSLLNAIIYTFSLGLFIGCLPVQAQESPQAPLQSDKTNPEQTIKQQITVFSKAKIESPEGQLQFAKQILETWQQSPNSNLPSSAESLILLNKLAISAFEKGKALEQMLNPKVLDLNQVKAIQGYYEMTLSLIPEFTPAYFSLSHIFELQNQPNEALRFHALGFEVYLKEHQNIARVFHHALRYIQLLEKTKNETEIIPLILKIREQLKKFSAPDKNELKHLNNQAYFIQKTMRLELEYRNTLKIEDPTPFDDALLKYPQDDFILTLNARFHNKKNPQKSFLLWKKAIKINPSNYFSHYDLGQFYLSKNNEPMAQSHFHQVLKIAPKTPYGKESKKYLIQLNAL